MRKTYEEKITGLVYGDLLFALSVSAHRSGLKKAHRIGYLSNSDAASSPW